MNKKNSILKQKFLMRIKFNFIITLRSLRLCLPGRQTGVMNFSGYDLKNK